ncbi:membrane-associated oxidoreductase [Streptomyces sp. B3I8]|uniref:membrane-associated oxidoreductase n=1 Tax=Streptomyces sp. B3I8 TaxID=3042303 RepID=UPI0027831FCB|nr:membrane-associated oxidoreductase [Streptomyces sp. B3I8]MDQ0790439.1 hypothetical protein [Streptomyces sp. B3I8]
MEIDELTAAERRVWEAFPDGTEVDFRRTPDENPADGTGGADWGPERTVRARVLRSLLLDGPTRAGEIPVLKVVGARITGTLDLKYATIDHAVELKHCHFTDGPALYDFRVRQLNLRGSVLPGLHAARLQVDGVLRLTDCRITYQVRLGGARIAGALFLDGAHLTSSDTSEPVLQLNQVTIGDALWAPGLRVEGETRLESATVTGSVMLRDARFENPGATALQARTLTLDADLQAGCLVARGMLDLRGARIPGQLNLSYARLSHPEGMALRVSSAVLGELWLREPEGIEGALNLRRARVDALHAAPEVWPGELNLDGLTYTALTPHAPAARRLAVLERDSDGYVPYAYEQLAAAYRRVGDERAARTVQLAKLRRHRGTLPWYRRLWGQVQDATVGYGFRPLRAAGWLLSLLAVGAVVFGLHPPAALKPDEAPPFNPVFYTLDLMLPVISFGQEAAFAPAGPYQALSYGLTLTGWILATTVLTGVTRAVSRQ